MFGEPSPARLRNSVNRAGGWGQLLTVDISLPEIEELHKLVEKGKEKGFLTYDEIVNGARGGRAHEGAARGLLHLPDRPRRRARRGRAAQDAAARAAARRGREGRRAEARPHRRALARLAAALPARDRQGAAAHRRPGGLAREADRARRHGREDADDRGEPPPRRLDREGLPRPRALVPRPDPGGLARPDPRGREVRLPQGLQVLDLRDLVDPPGGHARDRRQGAHDPHPGAHGREAEQGRPHRAPARAAPRPRAARRRRSPRSSR